MSGRDVRRFVEDLLRGRPTKPFRPTDADVAEMRTAIELRAARTGSGAPSEEFITGLHRRLAAELDDGARVGEQRATPIRGTRRRVLQVGSVAAAAAAVGAVVDHAVTAAEKPTNPGTAAADTLTPTTGAWSVVAASAEVPEGAVRPFEVGAVSGFVHRSGGALRAVSGTCTHQGCRLWLDTAAHRLQCPCHSTAFAVTGELINHALPVPPRPLPQLMVRETGDTIEVYAPPPTA